jgi:hypothetical protein
MGWCRGRRIDDHQFAKDTPLLYKNDSDQGSFRLLRDTPMLLVLGPRLAASIRSQKNLGSL